MPGAPRPIPSRTYDLAIVGGGVHGLFAAWEAAAGGASVVLLERDDFGAALSSNHQRTIHGGLRALQSGRFDRARAQIADRREWALMAPHLVQPLPFLLPTGGGLSRARAVVGIGLRAYNWLGRARNHELPESLAIPDASIVEVEELGRRAGAMAPSQATGAALWYDYHLRHPDRLNWLIASAAERAGAVVRNHTEVTGPVEAGGRITGLEYRDRLTGTTGAVRSARVLIAAGGQVGAVYERLGLGEPPPVVRACNLLVDRPATGAAVAARGTSGRMLTATPWAGYWLVGTFQDDHPFVGGRASEPTGDDVERMVADANAAFPALRLRRHDVRLVHHGLTPAVVVGGRAQLMPESRLVAHDAHVYALVGVKFTTARTSAREALKRLGLPSTSRADIRLPHGDADGAAETLGAAAQQAGVVLEAEVFQHLVDWYGTEAADVFAFAVAASLAHRLSPGTAVLEGELLYAVERARAARLADVVLRRTRLGGAGCPGREVLDRAADLVGAALGWSAAERATEVAAVEARYPAGTAGTTIDA